MWDLTSTVKGTNGGLHVRAFLLSIACSSLLFCVVLFIKRVLTANMGRLFDIFGGSKEGGMGGQKNKTPVVLGRVMMMRCVVHAMGNETCITPFYSVA
jgi:hypothetical protein